MDLTRRKFLWWISGSLASASLIATVGCALKKDLIDPDYQYSIKTNDASIDSIELEQIEQAYIEILDVQLKHLDRINYVQVPETERIKECFRRGDYLFKEKMIELDPASFLEIQKEICKTIKEVYPEAPDPLMSLPEAREFREENLEAFFEKIALMNKKELQRYISTQKLDQRSGLENDVIAFILYMSLAPFYTAYMQKASETGDFSIWRHGYCPVCGQTAVIARHRVEDEARVLFCWLCHAEWVFPRLECPYCDNNDAGKLRFFYVNDNRSHQIHVCKICKRYLKTVVGKTFEQEQMLNLKDIETRYLDTIAELEGFKRPI